MFRFPWLASRTRNTVGRKLHSRRLICEPLERREVLADLLSGLAIAPAAGENDVVKASDVAHDALGNTYLSGRVDSDDGYVAPIDFDTLNNYVDNRDILPAGDTWRRFIVKYNAAGAVQWLLPIYGAPAPHPVEIPLVVGSQNELYFSGVYGGTLTAGNHSIGPDLYGINDRFLGRVDASGTVSWLQGFNFDFREYAPQGITLDSAAGRLYLAGEQDNGSLSNLVRSSVVAAFDVTEIGASLAWSAVVGARTNDVALDSAGAVYVVGDLAGTADFDPSGATFNVSSGKGAHPPQTGFVWKLTPSGALGWVKAFQTPTNTGAGARAVAIDKVNPLDLTDDRIVVAGNFTGSVDFQPAKGTVNLPNAGSWDPYVASFSTGGTLLMARSFLGTIEVDDAQDVEVDAAGNIYVTGFVGGVPRWQYLAKLDRAGNLQSHLRVRGLTTGAYNVAELSLNPADGTVHMIGTFSGNLDVDLNGDGIVDLEDALIGTPSTDTYAMFWLVFTL